MKMHDFEEKETLDKILQLTIQKQKETATTQIRRFKRVCQSAQVTETKKKGMI